VQLAVVNMRSIYYITFALWICAVSSEEKLAKHFSLFSVVTFGNEECTSGTSISGGATAGTCYSSTECSDKNGMASGNCASGFGVCCVFLNTAVAAATTISENRTRIRNAEFPSITTATAVVTAAYTVNKMKDDICQIRLDFDTFVIAGPAVTTEALALGGGSACQDTFQISTTDQVSTNSNPAYSAGVLCGVLTGQHLYVELSPTAADTMVMTLTTAISTTITPAIAQRAWDLKVSQIECHATYKAPPGCHQYFMTPVGKMSSMNFALVTGATRAANAQNSGLHLATSHIRSCVRRAKNMCCVEYQLCNSHNGVSLADAGTGTGAPNQGIYHDSFSLDMDTTPFTIAATQSGIGMTDNECTGDYIEIPSSMSRSCGAMYGSYLNTQNTRYCGAKLGSNMQSCVLTQTGSSSICDCSEPWAVTMHFDDLGDTGLVGGNANQGASSFPRGVCLDYKQTPCYN